MTNLDPTLDLVAFGLNIVDDYAPDYIGWTVPPLHGCCNDAAAWSMLGALLRLNSTNVLSTYAGPTSALGGQVPPFRTVLDCTRQVLRNWIGQRAEYVTRELAAGRDPLTVLTISGHGAQEVYPLETIESLVLSDGLLPDFEFHNLLAKFPARARVLVILDTCHSGGMDRAAQFRYSPRFAGVRPSLDEEGRQIREVVAKEVIRANIAVLSACPKDTTALDGQFNGAFTGSCMSIAQDMLSNRSRPDTHSFFAASQALCERQFRQQPVATFYGDRSVWNKPFMS